MGAFFADPDAHGVVDERLASVSDASFALRASADPRKDAQAEAIVCSIENREACAALEVEPSPETKSSTGAAAGWEGMDELQAALVRECTRDDLAVQMTSRDDVVAELRARGHEALLDPCILALATSTLVTRTFALIEACLVTSFPDAPFEALALHFAHACPIQLKSVNGGADKLANVPKAWRQSNLSQAFVIAM